MEYLEKGLKLLSIKVLKCDNDNAVTLMHHICIAMEGRGVSFDAVYFTEGLNKESMSFSELEEYTKTSKSYLYKAKSNLIGEMKTLAKAAVCMHDINDVINMNINNDEHPVELLLFTKHVDMSTLNKIKQVGITTIGDIKSISMYEATLLNGIGHVTILSIREALKTIGTDFRDDQLRFSFLDEGVNNETLSIGM